MDEPERTALLSRDLLRDFDVDKLPEPFLAFAWANLSPRDRAAILSAGPRSVWMFGAGASHHYNLNASGLPIPLANGFLRAFHELPTSQGFHSHVGPLVSYLQNYRGIRPEEVPTWEENIESFMTSIEAEIIELRQKRHREGLSHDEQAQAFSASTAFNNMNFILANVINEAQNGPSASLYRDLLDFCSPNDSFLTFNWDTLLDRALADSGGWSPKYGYGIPFTSIFDGSWKQDAEGSAPYQTGWRLLKLHGSTNWLVPYSGVHLESLDFFRIVPATEKLFLYWQASLPFETHRNRWRGGYVPTCYGYYPPNLPTASFRPEEISAPPGHVFLKMSYISYFSPFEEPEGTGIPASPLLITPVRQKNYAAYQGTIEELWRQGTEVLRMCDRLTIIGYSFPETDTRVLKLIDDPEIPAGVSIELVGPDADRIVDRLTHTLARPRSLSAHVMKFDEYISRLVKRAPDLMRDAARRRPEVLDWLKRVVTLSLMSTLRSDSAGAARLS